MFKPQAKEFFADHSELVTKNKMTIKEFEKEQAKLLKDREVRDAWLAYESRFPHMSAVLPHRARVSAPDRRRRRQEDRHRLNLYKLFVERCFTLLRARRALRHRDSERHLHRPGRQQACATCSSTHTQIESIVRLSNEKFIFEGVHHSFGIVFLNFTKGGNTERFRATFRINPREAIRAEAFESFVHDESNFVEFPPTGSATHRPRHRSVMEFRGAADVAIVNKMLRFPMLGERIEGSWGLG